MRFPYLLKGPTDAPSVETECLSPTCILYAFHVVGVLLGFRAFVMKNNNSIFQVIRRNLISALAQPEVRQAAYLEVSAKLQPCWHFPDLPKPLDYGMLPDHN